MDNWNTFITTQFPLNPISASQTSYPAKQDDMQNIVYYDIEFSPIPSTTQRVYVNFINDAMTSHYWSDPLVPNVKAAYPNYPVDADGVPFGFFGIEYKLQTDAANVSTITGSIFVADLFSNRQQYVPNDQFDKAYERVLSDTESLSLIHI